MAESCCATASSSDCLTCLSNPLAAMNVRFTCHKPYPKVIAINGQKSCPKGSCMAGQFDMNLDASQIMDGTHCLLSRSAVYTCVIIREMIS